MTSALACIVRRRALAAEVDGERRHEEQDGRAIAVSMSTAPRSRGRGGSTGGGRIAHELILATEVGLDLVRQEGRDEREVAEERVVVVVVRQLDGDAL